MVGKILHHTDRFVAWRQAQFRQIHRCLDILAYDSKVVLLLGFRLVTVQQSEVRHLLLTKMLSRQGMP